MAEITKRLRKAWKDLPVGRDVYVSQLVKMAGIEPNNRINKIASSFLKRCVTAGGSQKFLSHKPSEIKYGPKKIAYFRKVSEKLPPTRTKRSKKQKSNKDLITQAFDFVWENLKISEEISLDDFIESSGVQKDDYVRQRAQRYLIRCSSQNLARRVISHVGIKKGKLIYRKIRHGLPSWNQTVKEKVEVKQEKNLTAFPPPPKGTTVKQFVTEWVDMWNEISAENKKLKKELKTLQDEYQKAAQDCKQQTEINRSLQEEMNNIKMNGGETLDKYLRTKNRG